MWYNPDYSFAVLSEFIPVQEGMTVKSFDGVTPETEEVLTSNYLGASPNPFNPSTSVQFGLVKAGNVEIDVFDIRGHHVVNLQTGFIEAGRHTVRWLARDSN